MLLLMIISDALWSEKRIGGPLGLYDIVDPRYGSGLSFNVSPMLLFNAHNVPEKKKNMKARLQEGKSRREREWVRESKREKG